MTILCVVIGIIYLIGLILLCLKFNSIANGKGYSGMSYFWLCLFFGFAGMILVAALPNNSDNLSVNTDYSEKTWTCKNCNQVNSMAKVSCSGCGKVR